MQSRLSRVNETLVCNFSICFQKRENILHQVLRKKRSKMLIYREGFVTNRESPGKILRHGRIEVRVDELDQDDENILQSRLVERATLSIQLIHCIQLPKVLLSKELNLSSILGKLYVINVKDDIPKSCNMSDFCEDKIWWTFIVVRNKDKC